MLNAGYLVSTVLEVMHNHKDIAILDTSAACHMPDVLEVPYRPPVYRGGEPDVYKRQGYGSHPPAAGAAHSPLAKRTPNQTHSDFLTITLFFHLFQQLLHIIRQIERALMQIGIVVSGFQSQTVPPVRIQIAHRMHAARRKAEQPVSGRVGRDMRLKQTAQLKRVYDIAVRSLARKRIALVERAFVLVDEHAVLLERLVAAAVKSVSYTHLDVYKRQYHNGNHLAGATA